jgi:hypothetical protein
LEPRPLDSLDLLAQLVRDPAGESVTTLREARTNTEFLLETLDGRRLGGDPRGVSDEVKAVIEKAYELSQEFHQPSVDWMHVLLAMILLGSASVAYLEEAGTDKQALATILRQRLKRRKEVN